MDKLFQLNCDIKCNVSLHNSVIMSELLAQCRGYFYFTLIYETQSIHAYGMTVSGLIGILSFLLYCL